MGSFNRLGFFSKLPICHGDDIVMIVCANTTARKHNLNSICSMTDSGIIPIAAPFFCEYNDYGGGEHFVEDANYKLFKEKFGMTVEEFDDYCADLSKFTLSDFRKGRESFSSIDKSPNDYHHETEADFNKMNSIMTNVFHPRKYTSLKKHALKDNNDTLLKQLEILDNWESENFENTGLMTIVEHRSVYDAFISAYKNSGWYTDATETYDLIAEYINGLRETLKDKFTGFNFLKHKIEPWNDTLQFHDLTEDEENKLNVFIESFNKKHPDANGKTLLFESSLHCTVTSSFEDHALYDNFTGDMMPLKDIVLDWLSFVRGFGFTHSSFCPSEIGGQDTEFDILIPVYEKMLDILKTKQNKYM